MARMDHLVALIYASNRCYTEVVSVYDKRVKDDVEIDVAKKVWKPKSSQFGRGGPFKIGEGRFSSSNDSYGTVIGIYDKTKLNQLDSIARDAKSATTYVNYHTID